MLKIFFKIVLLLSLVSLFIACDRLETKRKNNLPNDPTRGGIEALKTGILGGEVGEIIPLVSDEIEVLKKLCLDLKNSRERLGEWGKDKYFNFSSEERDCSMEAERAPAIKKVQTYLSQEGDNLNFVESTTREIILNSLTDRSTFFNRICPALSLSGDGWPARNFFLDDRSMLVLQKIEKVKIAFDELIFVIINHATKQKDGKMIINSSDHIYFYRENSTADQLKGFVLKRTQSELCASDLGTGKAHTFGYNFDSIHVRPANN